MIKMGVILHEITAFGSFQAKLLLFYQLIVSIWNFQEKLYDFDESWYIIYVLELYTGNQYQKRLL